MLEYRELTEDYLRAYWTVNRYSIAIRHADLPYLHITSNIEGWERVISELVVYFAAHNLAPIAIKHDKE